MHALSSSQVYVAKNVLLDGRLALFHEKQRWLAVADLHFGFELTQRAAGNLFPLWGMQTIEDRLAHLLGEYEAKRLLLLGDLVHDSAGAAGFVRVIERLSARCDVILLAGNHDRQARKAGLRPDSAGESLAHRKKGISDLQLLPSWQSDGFYFHHGDCAESPPDCVQIIGHHHPAGVLRDGAGLRLKLPAFVQQKKCWIMPAFSPWAAGTAWPNENESSRIWLCSPERVVRMDEL